jgi:hypothetical protein
MNHTLESDNTNHLKREGCRREEKKKKTRKHTDKKIILKD